MGDVAAGPKAEVEENRRKGVSGHACEFATYAIGEDTVLWEGLKVIFNGSPFRVVKAVSNVEQALRGHGPKTTTPDIALLDLSSGVRRVSHEIGHLLSAFPNMRVVVLAETATVHALRECVLAGAHGYLTKDIGAKTLILSLQMAMLGRRIYPTRVTGLLLDGKRSVEPAAVSNPNPCGLSTREIQIAQLVLHGDSNKMIANRLAITESTVKGHMNRIIRKTKVSNRTQAAIWVASAQTIA